MGGEKSGAFVPRSQLLHELFSRKVEHFSAVDVNSAEALHFCLLIMSSGTVLFEKPAEWGDFWCTGISVDR